MKSSNIYEEFSHINLCSAVFVENSSEHIQKRIANKRVVIIAGVQGFCQMAPRLGIEANYQVAQMAKNTAVPLAAGDMAVYFTSLAERSQAQAIAADIKARAAVGGWVLNSVVEQIIYEEGYAGTEDFASTSDDERALEQAAREQDEANKAKYCQNCQLAQEASKPVMPDLLLAIGGGVACDVGKLVANMLKLPVLCLPTIAATCASTSALSVLYKAHELDGFEIYDDLELEMIADLEILRAAPKKYLLAGIGDTMAKYYESRLQMRGCELDYANALGAAMVELNYSRLINANIHKDFAMIAAIVLLNTGLVSRLIRPEYNGALAHASCYALVAQGAHGLHGELVAFGLLVQLLTYGDEAGYEQLLAALRRMKLPVRLKDFMPLSRFDSERFVADVCAAEDVAALLARGDSIEGIRHAAGLIPTIGE